MSDDYDIDDLIPGKKNKKNHDDLISQLRDMEDDNYVTDGGLSSSVFFPSSMLKDQKKEKKKYDDVTAENYDPDEWFEEMLSFGDSKLDHRSKKIKNSLFENAGIGDYKKKKKKKKNKDGVEVVNYKQEFEPEMALYRNLLMDQNRFTESLQKEYDNISSKKGTSRGVTKQLTDLIANITSARALSMQLVEKNVNAKKLIADLSLKQKKELGLGANEGENMTDFASSYLKQMLTDRKAISSTSGENTVAEYSEDELFNELSNSLIDEEERPEEVEKYLKYENQNVNVYVEIYNNDIENYKFVAKNEDGDIIDDYPLPNHTNISVNRSTNIATDIFGKKYNIIWY